MNLTNLWIHLAIFTTLWGGIVWGILKTLPPHVQPWKAIGVVSVALLIHVVMLSIGTSLVEGK